MANLQIPIGLFFSIVGAILLILGLIYPDARAPLTPGNVNLYCGIPILAFGSVMLWLARRSF
jgi:hypothetical protein